jgi:hypothetical protein
MLVLDVAIALILTNPAVVVGIAISFHTFPWWGMSLAMLAISLFSHLQGTIGI